MPNNSFQRSIPTSPSHVTPATVNNDRSGGGGNNLRKASIVEILSSPPPLHATINNNDQEEMLGFSLSRNTSASSRTSSQHTASISYASNGLEWFETPVSDLAESNKLISIDSGYSVQEAFQTLVKHQLTSVPVALSSSELDDLTNCLTFDYSDLNTYLLLMMNKINFNDLNFDDVGDPSTSNEQKHDSLLKLLERAKRGDEVPVDLIVKLHPKNPFYKVVEHENLYKVAEILGSGVHRVAITDSSLRHIVGVLSQRRLIKYFWENARRFPSLEFLLGSTLYDLQIGSTNPITIFEDQLLIDALSKMFNERVTSLAIIDRSRTLMGNISIVDVRNVSSSKESHFLFKPVMNFVSYNLSMKGIEEGQDQYPIFSAINTSTLARVIAKLVATQAHRLWIVEAPRQGSSVSSSSSSTPMSTPTTVEAILSSPHPNDSGGMGGKLVGVVTLTDILGLFASSKGKKTDPLAARNQRRRLSTSSRGGVEPQPEHFRKLYMDRET